MTTQERRDEIAQTIFLSLCLEGRPVLTFEIASKNESCAKYAFDCADAFEKEQLKRILLAQPCHKSAVDDWQDPVQQGGSPQKEF